MTIEFLLSPSRILFFTFYLLLSTSILFADDVGVLVMAHGGSPAWNQIVEKTVSDAHLPYPHRVFFGMGCSKPEADNLESLLKSLKGDGVQTLVVVPLLVSSHSEVPRQWQYLLGLRIEPGFTAEQIAAMPPHGMAAASGAEHQHHAGMNMTMEPAKPVTHSLRVIFGEALDDDAVLVPVLLDRAREISKKPIQESVVLISHGPTTDADNQEWMKHLNRVAEGIRTQGQFNDVTTWTLRDDADKTVRDSAVLAIRKKIESIHVEKREALVIPVLLASGGIEHKLNVDLKGLTFRKSTHFLLPDLRISQWMAAQAKGLAEKVK